MDTCALPSVPQPVEEVFSGGRAGRVADGPATGREASGVVAPSNVNEAAHSALAPSAAASTRALAQAAEEEFFAALDDLDG